MHSLCLHGLQTTRLLHPWDFLGKNPGTGCHLLLQGTFPTQGSIPHLLWKPNYRCTGVNRSIITYMYWQRTYKVHSNQWFTKPMKENSLLLEAQIYIRLHQAGIAEEGADNEIRKWKPSWKPGKIIQRKEGAGIYELWMIQTVNLVVCCFFFFFNIDSLAIQWKCSPFA